MDIDELKARMRDHEVGWVERKSKNIKSDEICEALVSFANSLPVGQVGVLFIGVADDGKPIGVDNPDSMQKKVELRSKWCYPPVPYTARVFEEAGLPIVAIIIEGSSDRPHFAGPAFIRVGSQSQKASAKRLNELIDRRTNIVSWILRERDSDHDVYIEDKRYPGAPRSICKVVDCNSQFATFRVLPASDDFRSAPVSKILMSQNQGLAMFTIYP